MGFSATGPNQGYRPSTPACNVANPGCKAPPFLASSNTKAECFKCGLAVCTNSECSRRRVYGKYGRKRLCSHCIGELFDRAEIEVNDDSGPVFAGGPFGSFGSRR